MIINSSQLLFKELFHRVSKSKQEVDLECVKFFVLTTTKKKTTGTIKSN
jgi:hypothetical protein